MNMKENFSYQRSNSVNIKKWMINGTTVRGASHTIEHLSNQDSIYWLHSVEKDIGILSVADGHGSDTYFRSRIGSKIAAKIATHTMFKVFTNYHLSSTSLSGARDIIRFSIPKLLVKNWNDEVQYHVRKNPFTNDEVSRFLNRGDPSAKSKLYTHPQIAYGSTLLTAVVTKEYVLLFQLGDGNILVVDEYRNVILPLEKNIENCDGENRIIPLNYTNSLCMNSSWLKFNVGIYPSDDLKPNLILLTTDGYYNSFKDETEFRKIGTDYLDIMNNYGPQYMRSRLHFLLKETSQRGSGDDITLGYLYKANQ
jgi:hypothetical protein